MNSDRYYTYLTKLTVFELLIYYDYLRNYEVDVDIKYDLDLYPHNFDKDGHDYNL